MISRVPPDLAPYCIPLLPFPASLQLPARAPAPLCVPVCEGWSPMDHLHRQDVGCSMWFVAVFLMPRDAPDTWPCFDQYLSNTWKKMHAWQVCLQGSAPAPPFPADFLSVDLSVCVRLPRWLISAGTVTPCFDISMKTIKVRTHCGLPSSGCCTSPRGGSLPWVRPLQPRAQLTGTSHLAFGPLPSLGALLGQVNALHLWPGVTKHWSTGQAGQAPAPVSEPHRSAGVH